MANKFLFLELTDHHPNLVLANLRSIFSGASASFNIHITLKGPQDSFNLQKYIDSYKADNACIDIGGIGRFLNGNCHVVYLKVACGDLRKYKLWRKPDFENSYNPHITLYEGTNKALADAVYDFLKAENIEYHCLGYEFTVYTRKQYGLFSKVCAKGNAMEAELQEHEAYLLERAKSLIERVHSSNKRLQPTAQSAGRFAPGTLGGA